MEVIVAKTAGFCFGVDRALKTAYKNIDDEKMLTYGDIIHNKEVIKDLKEKNVDVVKSISEIDYYDAKKVILRSHGVSRREEEEIRAKDIDVIDVTCPYVKKIHNLAMEAEENGNSLIIAGDKNHSEVKGIAGWYDGEIVYLMSAEDAKNVDLDPKKNYELVAQTTFNNKIFKEIVSILQKRRFHVIIRNTICSATYKRQEEALLIAKKVDLMIVIGDNKSSNTRKLYDICKGVCEDTYRIETSSDFDYKLLKGCELVGITAGASTPKKLIEEVISNVRNAK
ncbi:MAG: 4-hydroxy-3-methylbut-2-enyl diphosphate reductase [Clostridiales bacterium]|nr:MAG: 4-hydroxy-3-methylbut-2-enyl diphosphate reductase [Clostridiales bacterium]